MKETWYVSCSPRNPAKIKKELDCLAKLEGENWDAKDDSKQNITQLKFAEMLSKLPDFEGKAAGKESDFSARDRVAPMKTYGFVYMDKEGRIKITKAGKALTNGENEEHIFLMQMLKWQYPSAQHCGPQYLDQPATLFEGRKLGFSILPFIFTSQVVKQVGGVTKREVAVFLLPHRRMGRLTQIAARIQKYRAERARKEGRVNKRTYDDAVHKSLYRRIYSDLLDKNGDKEKELRKKIRNSLDVADACMRLFRYTGLFATEKDRLVLNKTRLEEIDLILAQKWVPVDFYKDVEKFYEYFGDHEKPSLPFTSEDFLVKRILSLQNEINKFQIPVSKPIAILQATSSSLKQMPKAQLFERIEDLRELYRKLTGFTVSGFLRSREGQRDVLDFYETIIQREVADPAAFFEWNTWRALIALDDANKILPYTRMDDTLQPMDCAPGNRPDIIAEFEDYLVVVEVTLALGRRQYFTEAEPVTYHVAKCQEEEKIHGNTRKVYGLFIAPKINRNTVDYFYKHIQHLKVPDYGNVTVVPIDLPLWIEILEFANSLGYLRKQLFGSLLADIEREGLRSQNSDSWLETIPLCINTWMDKISES